MDDAEYYARRALRQARAADNATCEAGRRAHHRLSDLLRLKAEALRLAMPVVSPRSRD